MLCNRKPRIQHSSISCEKYADGTCAQGQDVIGKSIQADEIWEPLRRLGNEHITQWKHNKCKNKGTNLKSVANEDSLCSVKTS